MSEHTAPPEWLPFFKALADGTRLKMVGLLAQRSLSGEQLAQLLKVKPATVSHHLSKLDAAGLTSVRNEGHSKFYSLRMDSVHAMAGQLLKKETFSEAAEGLSLDAYDRKIVRDYFAADGSLKQIPMKQKKLLAVVHHLVNEFEPDRKYTEKQVNEILKRFHPDTATLRRTMIDHHLMERNSGKYWRGAVPASHAK